jgi:hypothetical protein
MQKRYLLSLKTLLPVCLLAIFSAGLKAQSVLLPYSYQLDQKFNSSIYSLDNSFHTSLKPFIIDSTLTPKYNQVMSVGVDSSRKGWIPRKIFNEHLFDVHTKEYTFYADYLTDLQVGSSQQNALQSGGKLSTSITTSLNTRGYQAGGTIGNNFYFYTSGFENSGVFPTYYANIINKIDLIPGQSYDRSFGASNKDWSYVTSILSYTVNKHLNVTLAEDKTFIGDGYRSLLLSDFTPNTPVLRLTANFGNFQYMIMWDYMEDPEAVQFDSFGNNRRKWGGFHYLDWNATNRLSFGFFNAVIAEEADDEGHYHGFDANFIDPLVYTQSLNSTTSQPDDILVGFTGKYKVFDKTAIYAQLLLDKFNAGSFFSNGSTNNTNGVQLGIRGADLFGVTNFNYLFEYNSVRPYTYSSSQQISSYSNYDEPLGDPFGANFRELVGILNYSIGRFDLQGQLEWAKYGVDPSTTADYGGDVLKVFTSTSIPTDVGPASTTPTTAYIGQGVTNKLFYAEGTVGFIINPKTNLRFELGAVFRTDSMPTGDAKTVWVTFGLRSSFRQIYHDF